jgi:hypothetical protein
MRSHIETTLTLRRAIWNKDVRRAVMNRVLSVSGLEVVDRIKDNIDNSSPAGRYYARKAAGTSRVKGRRIIVTPVVFHASSEGQPPARRFSTLYNSITGRRVNDKLQILVSVNAPGVEILDDPKKLDRPFFRSVITKYRRDEFFDNVKGGVNELLA